MFELGRRTVALDPKGQELCNVERSFKWDCKTEI